MRRDQYKYKLDNFTVLHELQCITLYNAAVPFASFHYLMNVRALRQGLESGQSSGYDLSIEALER